MPSLIPQISFSKSAKSGTSNIAGFKGCVILAYGLFSSMVIDLIFSKVSLVCYYKSLFLFGISSNLKLDPAELFNTCFFLFIRGKDPTCLPLCINGKLSFLFSYLSSDSSLLFSLLLHFCLFSMSEFCCNSCYLPLSRFPL